MNKAETHQEKKRSTPLAKCPSGTVEGECNSAAAESTHT